MKKILTFLILLTLTTRSMASIAVVQTKTAAPNATGTSYTITTTSTPTVNNVIIACIGYSAFGGVRTVTPPSGSWTRIDTTTNTNVTFDTWWYLVQAGDTGAYIWSFSGSSDWMSNITYEFSGVDTVNPINQHNIANSGTSSPIATPSVTPSVLSTYPLSCAGTDAGGAQGQTLSSVSGGWTADQIASPASGYHGTFSATHALTTDTSTAQLNSFNFSVNTPAAAAIILLKPSSSAPIYFLDFIRQARMGQVQLIRK